MANAIDETWDNLLMATVSGSMTPEAAEALAIEALGFLATAPEELERFMALSGLSPENLRHVAGSPEFLAAVLTYLAQDDGLLLNFAKSASCDPKRILSAKNCLDPPTESWP